MQKIEPGKIILGFLNDKDHKEEHYRSAVPAVLNKELGINMADSDIFFDYNAQKILVTVPVGKEDECALACRAIAGVRFAGTIAVLVKVPKMGIW